MRPMRIAGGERTGWPVCGDAYESVAERDAGLMVNLDGSRRYGRVCFDPVATDGEAEVWFYHHTYEQTASDRSGPSGASEE